MLKTAICGWHSRATGHRSTKTCLPVRQALLIMRLTLLFIVAAIFSVNAKGVAQNVTFSGKNVSLEKVFSVVEQQTGYVFLYPQRILTTARPVTIQAQEKPLLQFLDELFQHQPLHYSIESRTINVSAAQAPPAAVEKVVETSAPPVSGRVTDSLGMPIAGVTISVVAPGRGAYAATVSDVDGRFEVIANKGEKIVFSMVGYESRTIVVGDQTQVTIVLKVKAAQLDELVVEPVNTGYQKIRPEQSTGAVSQITTKEYESRVSTNFLDGLVNRLPGLMINNDVTFTSTVNGSQTSRSLFTIRGISTMSANQSPLIVVDGYPTELTLNMLDPNEIKSVTILKDAAAATVYGVRASNGVIVIERKQAAIGKPRFSFRATAGVTPKENYNRYRWVDDQSAADIEYERDHYATIATSSTWGQLTTKSSFSGVGYPPAYYIMAQQAAGLITPYQAEQAFTEMKNYDNTDEYSRLFLRSAVTQTYNMNVSGGNANALYYITANYTGNRQQQVNNSNNRIMLSGRSTIKFSNRLSLELTTNYQEEHYDNAPVPAITSIYPYEHLQDENGNPAAISSGSGTNPYYNAIIMGAGLEDNMYYPLVDIDEISNKTHTINNRITANFDYLIGHGFDLSFGGIYETSRSDISHYASEKSSEARQYVNDYATQNADGTITFNVPKGGFLREEADQTSSYTLRTQLNYNKKIGQHSFNGIMGAEVRNLINKSNLTSYFGYNDETLLLQPVNFTDILNNAVTKSFFTGGNITDITNYFNQQYQEDRFISGYFNMVYAFKNTYSLTGSIRIDQSNLFGTDPKYKYKPLWSVGAAWNIHNEQFMRDAVWVNMLKLRAADGFNGNVAKLSLPEVIAQYVLNTYTSPSTPALQKLSYANSSLRWEQTNNFNVGVDYRIFKRVSGSIDYYQKRSTDLLGNSQIDPTIGVSPSLINSATINNRGLEFSLHADWISTSKVNWNTGLILAHNKSKVLKVYQDVEYSPQSLNSLGYVEGRPVGAIFAYNYAGLDSAGYPLLQDPKGTLYHTDRTSTNTTYNNNVLALMKSDTSGLVQYMGSSIPTINAGLSNRIDVGNFYFYCMINYYGGFKVFVPRPNPSSVRPLEGADTYWKQPGDEQNTDVMTLDGYSTATSNYTYQYANKYVVNGDYITLADVTVSYSLDKMPFVKRAGFTHFEVKLQGSNLYTVGLNGYNYSLATGSYAKRYLTPTYTVGIFTNF